jgi:hypothetical protein
MEDNLNFSGNGRRMQFLKEMEDDLNLSGNGRQPQFQDIEETSMFQGMEDNLNFSGNSRQPRFLKKWKTTTVFRLENGIPPQFNQLIPNIAELFLLATVDSKFQIKNNLQLNQSQPSLT